MAPCSAATRCAQPRAQATRGQGGWARLHGRPHAPPPRPPPVRRGAPGQRSASARPSHAPACTVAAWPSPPGPCSSWWARPPPPAELRHRPRHRVSPRGARRARIYKLTPIYQLTSTYTHTQARTGIRACGGEGGGGDRPRC
jgi:hypothetical protein